MDNHKTESALTNSVMDKINEEQIKPTPWVVFFCAQCLMRMLWAVSIVVGALAVAISVFSILHTRYAFYEATHENSFTFIVSALPYLWVVVLFLMVVAAYYNFKNSGRGYRYSLSTIVVSSLALSVFGGLGLQAAGLGGLIDNKIGDMMPYYSSQENRELALWQQPEEGRLVGQVHGLQGDNIIRFIDITGSEWKLQIADLYDQDIFTLKTGNQVRVLGLLGEEERTFHACGVFPWMFDNAVSLQEMAGERRAFVERMYAHKDDAELRAQELEAEVIDTNMMGACAGMDTVRRIGESMQ
ncbi:MAG: hypothetical protein AAGA35_01350 [Patescibacteria group bacterium]